MSSERSCAVEGCKRDSGRLRRGWYDVHYSRWWRTGDPGPAESLRLPHVTAHGTYNEYQNYGCRCELCRAAMADWNREHLLTGTCIDCGTPVWVTGGGARRCQPCSIAIRTTPIELLHGTETGYSRGCRCQLCRKAQADARRTRRHRNPEHQRAYDRARRARRKAAA